MHELSTCRLSQPRQGVGEAPRIQRVNGHRLAEERSLELHRLIVDLIERDPSALDRARARVREWVRDGSVAAPYARAWEELLGGPPEVLSDLLVDEGERARALRQVTPFAGLVDPRTRWKIWREVRERLDGAR